MSEGKWYLVQVRHSMPGESRHYAHVALTQHPEQYDSEHVKEIPAEQADKLREGALYGLSVDWKDA